MLHFIVGGIVGYLIGKHIRVSDIPWLPWDLTNACTRSNPTGER